MVYCPCALYMPSVASWVPPGRVRPPRSRMKAKRKASRMAFLLHLIGMGMGLCTLVVYACIKVGAESEAADYAG